MRFTISLLIHQAIVKKYVIKVFKFLNNKSEVNIIIILNIKAPSPFLKFMLLELNFQLVQVIKIIKIPLVFLLEYHDVMIIINRVKPIKNYQTNTYIVFISN